MRTRTRLSALAGLAALSTAFATGCASQNLDDVSYGTVRGNLTPALQTSVERPIDVDRNIAVVHDTDLRLLMDDLGRALHTNRPSRLTPFPIIKPSGQP